MSSVKKLVSVGSLVFALNIVQSGKLSFPVGLSRIKKEKISDWNADGCNHGPLMRVVLML
jgi:hypothetical protein